MCAKLLTSCSGHDFDLNYEEENVHYAYVVS